MRRPQYPRSCSRPQAVIIKLLVNLFPIEHFGRHLPAEMIARIMVWIAIRNSTRRAACDRLQLPVGKETLRKAIVAATPCVENSLQLILQSVPAPLLRHLKRRKRGTRIAIDLHHQPYYGQPVAGVHRAKAKQGTKQFWSVATAAVVSHGERVTLTVVPVYSNRMEDVLEAMWAWIRGSNIKVSCLLLDRGFYGGPVIRWLQQHDIRYVMPLIKRGNARQGTGTARFFQRGQTGFRTHRWRERNRGAWVETGVAIVPHPTDRRRRPYVFAVGGRFASLAQCQDWYRTRFGIESSYRESKEIRGWTTSHDAAWRRLLQILSFAIRNLWVGAAWLISSCNSSPIRLQRVLDLLEHHLQLPYRLLNLTPD